MPITLPPNPITILHTDDSEDYGIILERHLQPFGINVKSVLTNEEAYTVASDAFDLGTPYFGIVSDYDTRSHMGGAELQVRIAQDKINGRPIISSSLTILSSSSERKIIQDELQEQALALGFDPNNLQIDIFHKFTDYEASVLFIALRGHNPEQLATLKREDLIRWAGFSMDEEGNVEEPFEFQNRMHGILDNVKREGLEGTLQDLSHFLSEGNHGRNPELK